MARKIRVNKMNEWIPPEMRDEYITQEYSMTRHTSAVKKKTRKQRRQEQIANQAGENQGEPRNVLTLKTIKPKTENQTKFFDFYEKSFSILAHGSAGTGKSFLAIYLAMRELANPETKRKKLYIVRSAVSSRDQGFLPGNEKEKMAVYEAPYKSIFAELYGRADAYDTFKKRGTVEFISTSFARGMTFRDAIIILDECANMTESELDTMMTRPGDDCRLVVLGDTRQNDLHAERFSNVSGFEKAIKILKSMTEYVRCVEFGVEDIVRSGFVKAWITQRDKF